MTDDFKKEMHRYIGLPKEEKILWLNYLMFDVSISARYFYYDGVRVDRVVGKAVVLSRYTEFLHRIVSFQMSVIVKMEHTIPDEVFFDTSYHTMKDLGIDVDRVVKSIRGWMS